MTTLCVVSWRLEQTAESYSLSSSCHAPERLVGALADHGCSQYTSIAAYDYRKSTNKRPRHLLETRRLINLAV